MVGIAPLAGSASRVVWSMNGSPPNGFAFSSSHFQLGIPGRTCWIVASPTQRCWERLVPGSSELMAWERRRLRSSPQLLELLLVDRLVCNQLQETQRTQP